MQFVILGILVILAFIGLSKPYFGLLALLIVYELQPGELYPSLAPLHLERVMAILVLGSFILHAERLRFPAPTKWFLAFYGAMIISIPLAFWRSGSLSFCIWFFEIVVYHMLAAALLTTERRIRNFILAFVLLVDWLGGSALYNYHHGIWQYAMDIDRAVGVTSSAGDPNTLANTLVTMIPLALVLMVRGNPVWLRIVGAASAVLCVVTIVDTGSRTAALSIVLLTLLLMVRKPKNLRYLPLVLVLSPVVWYLVPQQYKARYETVDHLKDDESYQNRVLSWQGGIKMFESNPITGIGPGNYAIANGEKYWPGTGRKHWLNAHSLYFKTLGELGLMGVVTFFGYVLCCFRMNFRVRKKFVAEKASTFLQELPSMFNIIFCLLLFSGYSSHNTYRSTWYIVGAMVGALSLLPSLQGHTVNAEEPSSRGAEATPEWSPALLPALRRQASGQNLLQRS